MRAQINDLNQFFEFASIINCLKMIRGENSLVLGDQIDNILEDVKPILKTSLKLNTLLTQFLKEFNLSIIDLDLLQMVVKCQLDYMDYQTYIRNSILDNNLSYKTIINKLKKSTLIKKKIH